MKICVGAYKGAVYNYLLEVVNELAKGSSSKLNTVLIKNIKEWENG